MICQKCKDSFPIKIKIKGRIRHLGNRKFCLKCSPFGKHNTRFPSNKEKYCLECNKLLKSRRRNYCPACSVRNSRRKKKKELVSYRGGKCMGCGYDYCYEALEFHHTNPLEKEFTISQKMTLSIEKLKKEADKCILLCSRCHTEVGAGRRGYYSIVIKGKNDLLGELWKKYKFKLEIGSTAGFGGFYKSSKEDYYEDYLKSVSEFSDSKTNISYKISGGWERLLLDMKEEFPLLIFEVEGLGFDKRF